MKKIVLMISIAIFLVSCSLSNEDSLTNPTTSKKIINRSDIPAIISVDAIGPEPDTVSSIDSFFINVGDVSELGGRSPGAIKASLNATQTAIQRKIDEACNDLNKVTSVQKEFFTITVGKGNLSGSGYLIAHFPIVLYPKPGYEFDNAIKTARLLKVELDVTTSTAPGNGWRK